MANRPWGVIKETGTLNKTLCDYDGSLPRDIRQRIRAVVRMMDAHPVKVRLDRTRRGYHLVVIWDRDFTRSQIVALQAILGSDPYRELMNLMRAECRPPEECEEYWNVLYERKLHYE